MYLSGHIKTRPYIILSFLIRMKFRGSISQLWRQGVWLCTHNGSNSTIIHWWDNWTWQIIPKRWNENAYKWYKLIME